MQQGTQTIRKELNLFSFLKNQRLIMCTLNSITTFEQRRLIKQQVKAGLLVAPVDQGKKKGAEAGYGKKKGSKKLWDSEDEETSSDEDFNFLEERLKKNKQLSTEDMRYLRGILQPPFKDRKNPERMKRKWGAGDTDASDEESTVVKDKNKVVPSKKDKRSLEEQIREMNLNANQFNFYAMDKPAQK